MIEIKGANKYFNRGKKNQLHVIDNTTLTFEDKGLVAILGNSGCGKTTLLNAIGGLDKISSGKIFINGKRITRKLSSSIDSTRNLNIGYIFQNYQLIDTMSVFDNVALVLKMLGIRNKEEIKKSVDYVLEAVGLFKYRNRLTSMLSGGERQRVGIARAIVKNPGIIIADEPTGNLDSKNSLEVMNIIKAISKDKLVILVTHEKDLAYFYADRIIELVDGKVVSDKENEHTDDLDYRIDNKIYLRDLPVQKKFKSSELNVGFYSDSEEALNINLVVKGGNLYIEGGERKIEVVDSSSSIELVDDNYRAITKDDFDEYGFDYEKITSKKKKLRYTSVYNPVTLLINGFKKVFNYPVLKKILLLGFIVSSMFVMYSLSNAFGVMNVTDDEFVTVNKNYLVLKTVSNSVDEYLSVAQTEGVGYVLPGDSVINLNISYSSYYYQTHEAADTINGSMSSITLLTQDDIISGKLPEEPTELVLDTMVLDKLFENQNAQQVGLKYAEDFIGKQITVKELPAFTIVGICDKKSPSIYVDDAMFFPILTNMESYMEKNDDADNAAVIKDYNLKLNEISITGGNFPTGDYQVIVNEMHKEEWPLYKTINQKINGVNLTVVGYYKSSTSADELYTNQNTVNYQYIRRSKDLSIYPTDAQAVSDYFTQSGMNIQSTYENSKQEYMNNMKDSMTSTLIIAAVVLLISLVEIFLMLRSSFLSRVKEVGTLRAIGLKKFDIYKMFLGEIIAITFVTSTIGFALMGYILHSLTSISYFANMYMFNKRIILLSVVVVYAFNIIIGLLPVFNTLRKTPAQILARTDVD